MRFTTSISDDMDQFYVGAAGYSPMERIMAGNSRILQRAEAISKKLVQIGLPAADAVALGLRMQGQWREYLLPYARSYERHEAVSDALKRIRKRKNDPLRDSI
jgi:hypothetical protein